MDIKILLKAIPFELERSISSHLNRLFKRRPSSAPFLSGDTFRAFADVLYDETKKCSAHDIKENSIVFVSSWNLLEFAQKILPKITVKFVLLTHQGDENITNTDEYKKIADDKNIKHWFAENCTLEHHKVTPLPIGLENAWRHNAGCLMDFKKLVKKQKITKVAKTVIAFTLGTNPDARFSCYRSFWKKNNTVEFPSSLSCRQYRKRLQNYMFIASPSGNGVDCHRMWEAIYLGVVPIVEKNPMNNYFISLGLPIFAIDSWDEVTCYTQEELSSMYHSIMSQAITLPAYFEYWKQHILMKKQV